MLITLEAVMIPQVWIEAVGDDLSTAMLAGDKMKGLARIVHTYVLFPRSSDLSLYKEHGQEPLMVFLMRDLGKLLLCPCKHLLATVPVI